jgi:hypothetical protein
MTWNVHICSDHGPFQRQGPKQDFLPCPKRSCGADSPRRLSQESGPLLRGGLIRSPRPPTKFPIGPFKLTRDRKPVSS